MDRIEEIIERDDATIAKLSALWESAVRATHDFLTEEDIVALRPEVTTGLRGIDGLYGYADSSGSILGFLGVQEGKVEMLFIDAAARGKGVGKKLITFAHEKLGACSLDVNEQNEQAVGFYKYLGFKMKGRSEYDEQGRPFPLLHMVLDE